MKPEAPLPGIPEVVMATPSPSTINTPRSSILRGYSVSELDGMPLMQSSAKPTRRAESKYFSLPNEIKRNRFAFIPGARKEQSEFKQVLSPEELTPVFF